MIMNPVDLKQTNYQQPRLSVRPYTLFATMVTVSLKILPYTLYKQKHNENRWF